PIGNRAVGIDPFLISSALGVSYRSITEPRRRRTLEGAIRQRHVRASEVKRFRMNYSLLGGLRIWKKFFVCHQMPHRTGRRWLDIDKTQQTKPAFELEN